MLPVRGRHHWLEAHRAIAAHHGGRGRGRVCGDHQSLGWWECVAAIGKRCGRCCCGRRMAGQWGGAWRCDRRAVAVWSVLGLSVPMCSTCSMRSMRFMWGSSSGEGLASVSIVASVGVGVIVGFGVVPVPTVVCIGRRQSVIL